MKKLILVLPLLILGCGAPISTPPKQQRIAAQDPDIDPSVRAEIERMRHSKDWGGLQQFCSTFLVTNPKAQTMWVVLGEAEDKLGHTDASVDACNTALKLDPSSSDAWFNLGIAYNHANQHEKVLDSYNKLTELNSNRASEFWNSYGNSSRKTIDQIQKSGGQALKVKFRPATIPYPQNAKNAGIQGLVSIALFVGVDGRVKKTEILEGPEELRMAAIEYGKQWVFEPLIIEGKTIEAKFLLRVPFKLK